MRGSYGYDSSEAESGAVKRTLRELSDRLVRLDQRVGVRVTPRARPWRPNAPALWDADDRFALQRRDLVRLVCLLSVGIVVGVVRDTGSLGLLVVLLFAAAGLVVARAARQRLGPTRRTALRWERYPLVPPDAPVVPVPAHLARTLLVLAAGGALAIAVASLGPGLPYVLYLVLAGNGLRMVAQQGLRPKAAQREWRRRTGQRLLVTARLRGRTYYRQRVAAEPAAVKGDGAALP